MSLFVDLVRGTSIVDCVAKEIRVRVMCQSEIHNSNRDRPASSLFIVADADFVLGLGHSASSHPTPTVRTQVFGANNSDAHLSRAWTYPSHTVEH
jgi:hypothetical protein